MAYGTNSAAGVTKELVVARCTFVQSGFGSDKSHVLPSRLKPTEALSLLGIHAIGTGLSLKSAAILTTRARETGVLAGIRLIESEGASFEVWLCSIATVESLPTRSAFTSSGIGVGS